jgi:hypothetical protein
VQDSWRVNNRVTFNLGLRLDRYRAFLPEQEGPPVGPFNPTQLSFEAIDNVVTFNELVPRIGMVFDLTGAGRTVLKANWGKYAWNPGASGIGASVNQNAPDWYRRYAWTDRNVNNRYDAGEEGVLIAQRGGAATSFLDPDIKDTMTTEVSGWLEHELLPGFAIAGGYVYRSIDNFQVLVNENRPMSAYNVPITIRDPGPDGVLGNADDGAGIPGFNLAPGTPTAVRNIFTNLPGSAEYHTLEFSANKRQSGRWSLQGSFAIRMNEDQSTGYFGNNLRAVATPSTPNDLINTEDGRYNWSVYNVKINGSYDAPYRIRITPALRVQQGQAFGRTFLAGAAHGINYGTQRILAEPIDTQHQDNIVLLDIRTEKFFQVAAGKRVGLFFDVYNLTNADAAQNINWGSGGTYRFPVTIIGPTIMRFGAKFDW